MTNASIAGYELCKRFSNEELFTFQLKLTRFCLCKIKKTLIKISRKISFQADDFRPKNHREHKKSLQRLKKIWCWKIFEKKVIWVFILFIGFFHSHQVAAKLKQSFLVQGSPVWMRKKIEMNDCLQTENKRAIAVFLPQRKILNFTVTTRLTKKLKSSVGSHFDKRGKFR